MKAAIYRRISNDREGRELGVERQLEDCESLARARGYDLVEVFTDNDSGASTHSRKRRPAYERMIRDAQGGRFDVIVAYTSGRLTRRPRENEDLVDLATKHRVSFAYVASPAFDLNSSMGLMVARIMAAKDAAEADDISERSRRARRQRAELGQAHAGGKRAFGYDATGTKTDRKEAAALKWAYGALISGTSLTGIAKALDAKGILTTQGKTWSRMSLRGALLNPRNASLSVYHGEVVGQGTWPAIVPQATYEAAVAILRDPRRRSAQKGNVSKWFGASLYRCGRCDDTRLITTYRTQGRRAYRCPECGLTRAAEVIDVFVTTVLTEYLNRHDLLARELADDDVDSTSRLLREERQALLSQQESLADDLTLPVPVLSRRVQAIEERLAVISEALAKAGRTDALDAIRKAKRPGDAWAAIPDLKQRQAIAEAVCVIRVMPVTKIGSREFDPATVRIEPAA